MEIILLERVAHVGNLGEKVQVKPGFGRNYLIPTGKALSATKANLKLFEARRAELEAAAKVQFELEQAKALVLEGLKISITAQAGEEGKLFGSVGQTEIVQALKALGHTVAKSTVRLPVPIRQIGDYEVILHLQGEKIVAKIFLTVLGG